MESKIPKFLIEKLESQYGKENLNKIIQGYIVDRKTSFRVNTIKISAQEVENILKQNEIEYERVKWCSEAFIIKNAEENKIKSLDIYENGQIYLQSLSSMLPPIILEPKEEQDILDMAAAPGGKTSQIAVMTNNKANITACELNHIRAQRLKYNIEKQGATSVFVMETDSRKIDSFFSFNKVLLDAPCSGSGTINVNDKDLEKTFTKKLLEKTVQSQKQLITKAFEVLKPGGEMVYSTCSILKEENEDIVNLLLKNKSANIIPIKIENEETLPLLKTNIEGTICIAPNELYEGFFVAKIIKK